MEWQPIETAPKVGILDDPIIIWDGVKRDTAFWEGGGWLSATDYDECEHATLHPTHWMPLPEPPK